MPSPARRWSAFGGQVAGTASEAVEAVEAKSEAASGEAPGPVPAEAPPASDGSQAVAAPAAAPPASDEALAAGPGDAATASVRRRHGIWSSAAMLGRSKRGGAEGFGSSAPCAAPSSAGGPSAEQLEADWAAAEKALLEACAAEVQCEEPYLCI